MSLIAKEKNGVEIEAIPVGVYIGVAYATIDLGTHLNPTFNNESHKVLIQWEIPEVRGEFERDGKKVNLPRVISKRYTVSLSEKANLRKDLESWRARRFTPQELSGFDLKAILGTACQLQITHSEKEGRTFANIASIMALPRGTKAPKPENPLTHFSFEELSGKAELPAGLPEWIVNIIKQSKEWKELVSPTSAKVAPSVAAPEPGADDDLF